ncbi:hypothetical protein EXIGLDRAFT_207385 [Exidia glandulosa HHB12029]|uniref:Uncharacterized protein n=1 Tax=Exidia glandulosa HHB12029 TaxID=1314781 RepID=A0A165ELK1_EXIGL|nr:hypothetical protein EXIGLDRAFT_207385 [Exidia glandulosa HHB12029]
MAMSRCSWKACAATIDYNTPEALFAHLCDSHYATRCERRHFFACEWKGCYELVPCPGSKGETLLCAVKGHLLDHAEYRPKSLGALRTLKASGCVSSLSGPEVPATGTAAAVVVPTPTATPPPHIRVPRLLPPLYPGLNSPAPPSLDVYVPYSHSDAAARPRSSIVTPRVGALTGRTISPTFDLPPAPRPPGVTISAPRTVSPTSDLAPPLVQSPGPGFATWKCRWSACTINLPVPFENAEDLLAHVLEVHVRPRSPDTPRNTVSVTDTTGRTRTSRANGRSVTQRW